MKINEIIVESRSQLDEGMMDTIKRKLSGVLQMARKKYPNFDEVFNVAKSHKAEINDIVEQLKAKKESGKLSKEDVISAIIPLSKKIAGDTGINEGMLGSVLGGALAGATTSPFIWFAGFIITLFSNTALDFTNTFYTCIAIGAALGALVQTNIDNSAKVSKRESEIGKQKANPIPHRDRTAANSRREQSELQSEYKRLERYYQTRRNEMSYAQTRRMQELYDQGFR